MFYDVRRIESYSLKISIENGRVEKVKFDESRGKAFRVLKNGFWGYFVGDVDDREGIYLAEKNAIGKGDVNVLNVSSGGKFTLKPKEDFRDVSVEEKVEFLRDVEKNLKGDKIVSTSVTYFENVRRFSYYDSNGNEVFYEIPRIGLIVSAVAKDRTLQFYSKRIMKPAGLEALKGAYDIANEVVDVVTKLVNANAPPSGDMNVVADSSLAGVFIHEAFGHAVEGDHVLQGASVLANKLGQKVADESVNIYDDPTLREFGFYPFDDEGVKAEKRTIVENGILKDFLHSRETALKFNSKAGNSRAEGLKFPIVRMSNTYLDRGQYKFDELLEIAKDGVYLVGSRGGETNPATGYFQFNAQYGYLIEGGELTEMIRDVSLSGYTLEILKNIKIGCELEFDPGFCGKEDQLVPVSDGSPHILIKALVGGS
ncbi:TldD/PmbA family protein [Archaeoglobus sp.]